MLRYTSHTSRPPARFRLARGSSSNKHREAVPRRPQFRRALCLPLRSLPPALAKKPENLLRSHSIPRRWLAIKPPVVAQSIEDNWDQIAARFHIDTVSIKPIEEILPKFGEARLSLPGLATDLARAFQQIPVGVTDMTSAEKLILVHRLLERAVSAVSSESLSIRVKALDSGDFEVRVLNTQDELTRLCCIVASDSTEANSWKVRARCTVYPALFDMAQPWLDGGSVPDSSLVDEDEEVEMSDEEMRRHLAGASANRKEEKLERVREYDSEYVNLSSRSRSKLSDEDRRKIRQASRKRAQDKRRVDRATLLLPPVAAVMTTLTEWIFVRYVPSTRPGATGAFYESEEITVDLGDTSKANKQHRDMVSLLTAALA